MPLLWYEKEPDVGIMFDYYVAYSDISGEKLDDEDEFYYNELIVSKKELIGFLKGIVYEIDTAKSDFLDATGSMVYTGQKYYIDLTDPDHSKYSGEGYSIEEYLSDSDVFEDYKLDYKKYESDHYDGPEEEPEPPSDYYDRMLF